MAKKDSNEDEQKDNLGNNSDDTFGLPEIEYKPINREEETTSSSASSETTSSKYEYQPSAKESSYSAYSVTEEESPVWPKILGILLVVALALGAVAYFMWYKPMQQEKEKLLAKQKLEQAAKQKEQDRLAEEARQREADERRKADSLANVSKVGMIEALNDRTGRYYVVITSAVDGDLIMDHAKKLSSTGVSCKIIPPFGKYKFYRLTIADGDTFAAAQDIANSKKEEYGETWVLKY